MPDTAIEFPGSDHDHESCVSEALARAEAVCAAAGARLTPKRRAVLEVMLADHTPRGAYEIADHVAWEGKRPTTVAIYRALDFLAGLGLVHRLESLNAFVACTHSDRHHRAQFLVCTDCRRVAEVADPGLERSLKSLARGASFAVESAVVELRGHCADCVDAPGDAGLADDAAAPTDRH